MKIIYYILTRLFGVSVSYEYKNNRREKQFVDGNLLVVGFITSIMVFTTLALTWYDIKSPTHHVCHLTSVCKAPSHSLH
jgi:hypothetical protein